MIGIYPVRRKKIVSELSGYLPEVTEQKLTSSLVLFQIGVPALLFTVLFIHRREIDEVMSKLVALKPRRVADCAFSVERLHKDYPKEVSHLLLSMASKFEKFRGGDWWFGIFCLLVRLLQTSLLTFFSSPNVQCTFAAMVALVSVVIQRELEPYRIQSDGLVAMVAQWVIFLWLSGLLLLRVGVLSSLPPLLVGTLLILTALGVLCVAGISAYKEGKRSKEQAKAHRASVVGYPFNKGELQIEMTDVSFGTGRGDVSLPEGWRYTTDSASGFGYLSYSDGYSIWGDEALMLAKFVAAHPNAPVDAPPSDEPSTAAPITHRPRPSSSASVASSSPFDLEDVFGSGRLLHDDDDMEAQASSEHALSSNANPLHLMTRDASKRALVRASITAANSATRAVRFGDDTEAQGSSEQVLSSNANPLHMMTRDASQHAVTKRASVRASITASNSTTRAVRFGSVRLASVPRGNQESIKDDASSEEINADLSSPREIAQGDGDNDASAEEDGKSDQSGDTHD